MTMFSKLRKLSRYLSLREFFRFWKGLFTNRAIVLQLVVKDFTNKFTGSILGVFWAFVQPLIFVMVLWFVFSMGLRSGRSTEPVPFVLWLMVGMFLWFFFSECILNGAGAILQNAYLVNKIKFQVSILPLVKILSALFIHVIFVLFLFILFIAHGFWPDLYWFQVFYYLLAAILLAQGLSWISSSINVFVKDTTHIIQILVRIGFWFTPIFWKIEKLPEEYQFFVKLNPVHYLIQGYRDSLIYKVAFWQRPVATAYFWGVTLFIFVVGALIFKRLRPHFADVL